MKGTNGNGMNGNGNGAGARWGRSAKRNFDAAEQQLASYRRLAVQLHYELIRPENPRSVLLVTPGPSELGAHSSTALARCLGEDLHQSVLLVDACPRQPDTSYLLECGNQRGFSEVLSHDSHAFHDLVLPTSRENVSFLAAGAHTSGFPPAWSERLSSLLKTFESRYDFVVLAGGSVLDNAAALAMASHVGCVLLLAVEDETRLDDLDAAQAALALCKARKVGVVYTQSIQTRRLLPDFGWNSSQRDSSTYTTIFSSYGEPAPTAPAAQSSDDSVEAVRLISAVNSVLTVEAGVNGGHSRPAEAPASETAKPDNRAAVAAVGGRAAKSIVASLVLALTLIGGLVLS